MNSSKQTAAATNMDVAETIAAQMGGTSRLTAMLGAKHFNGDADSLTFKFTAPAKNKANCIKITLDHDTDTYTVQWYTIRGINVKEGACLTMVHVDALRGVFERATELRLSL